MNLPLPIQTERLRLRLFQMTDAPTVQQLAGDYDVAKMTLTIPHPYPDGVAERWIATHGEGIRRGTLIEFAITRHDGTLIGAISLAIRRHSNWGEMGYWVGKPYWNQGYCTEAAKAVIQLGFDHLGLNRIQARHMTVNPASGRVMQKCGMTYEGTLRQAAYREPDYHDLALYSILRSEYERDRASN